VTGLKFEQKLKSLSQEEIWQEYCGFLDLTMEEYMQIQNRLMEEQIFLWSRCALGQRFLQGKEIHSIDEFRRMIPLTTYEDYADVLLPKHGNMLPDDPIIWIQTTWEGGRHPIKVAPYTKSMLDTYRNNVLACMILSTTETKGKFDVTVKDTFLYGLAPLPYATGLFPLALNDEINIEFLPSVKEAVQMSFSERNKKGFKLGLSKGIDFFFGLGSVAYFVSQSLSELSKSGGSGKSGGLSSLSAPMLMRLAKAKYRCSKENREMLPKDLFNLKGFMVAGTDNNSYKDDLERLWGVRPMELFAGTEPSCIGTETWTRNGMYFFPDTCFYEFIPEQEMERSFVEPGYQPKTYLMNEVIPGEKYELVITVLKGGAFARYRVGDVYQCVGLENPVDGTRIPRFHYIDRIPTIIDIAGFTRISENSIQNVISLSGLQIVDWVAAKEYNHEKRPLLHLYVEIEAQSLASLALSKEILREHLSVYFKYVDQDYKDLKRILDVDPLEITILRCGTFAAYQRQSGKTLRKINPSAYDIMGLLRTQETVEWDYRGGLLV
jgi:hypothetical protein